MGILRLLLAVSVVVAHVGPVFGLGFFGGGVMSVESFYLLSGFYMAMVLTGRYKERTADFYFNRYLRLFPIYWILLAGFVLVSLLYWLVTGHPLGALSAWREGPGLLHGLWACFSNLLIVGSDVAELYCGIPAAGSACMNHLIVMQPVWSLSVELGFYLAAPFVLRLRLRNQFAVFLFTLGLRLVLWHWGGDQWTVWLYYFAPAAWVFFMGGVQAYHLFVWLAKQPWFHRHAKTVGWLLVSVLGLLIVFYSQWSILRGQDWRYYTLLGLALPFVFITFKNSPLDAFLAQYSYPVYLSHWLVMTLLPPLRHFLPKHYNIHVTLALTFLLSFLVLKLDERIQKRFKRRVTGGV